jgi:deoxycytidylate deaminase
MVSTVGLKSPLKDTGGLMNGRHKRWIDRAILAANNSEHPQWWLGACVVKSGRVLSVGWNRDQNDPAYLDLVDIQKGKASTHAEIDALRHAGDPRGSTIYVGRITRSGYIACARPCRNCLKHIAQAGVKSVWWTDYDGKFGNIRL